MDKHWDNINKEIIYRVTLPDAYYNYVPAVSMKEYKDVITICKSETGNQLYMIRKAEDGNTYVTPLTSMHPNSANVINGNIIMNNGKTIITNDRMKIKKTLKKIVMDKLERYENSRRILLRQYGGKKAYMKYVSEQLKENEKSVNNINGYYRKVMARMKGK